MPESFAAPFKCWSYQRPVGHSKSSAVRRGSAPLATEWAFALLSKDGLSYEVSKSVSGFKSEADAIHAATAACQGER